MAAREDIEAYRQALATLSERAQADLRRLWAQLDPMDRITTRDVLIEFLTDIIHGYGDGAAVIAADFFELVRAEVTDDIFVPKLSEPTPSDQIAASTRWALSGLFVPNKAVDLAAVLGNLEKVTDRLTKQPARETFATALSDDPLKPRYARVPSGATTCMFCAMLASRGAVYLSEESAGAGAHDYHDHCDCTAVAIYSGQALPDGYDPDHYLGVYQGAGGASIDLQRKYDPAGKFVFSEAVATSN